MAKITTGHDTDTTTKVDVEDARKQYETYLLEFDEIVNGEDCNDKLGTIPWHHLPERTVDGVGPMYSDPYAKSFFPIGEQIIDATLQLLTLGAYDPFANCFRQDEILPEETLPVSFEEYVEFLETGNTFW